jgi:hypothetical protein
VSSGPARPELSCLPIPRTGLRLARYQCPGSEPNHTRFSCDTKVARHLNLDLHAEELRQTAQRLIDEATRLLARPTELEKQISVHDSRQG